MSESDTKVSLAEEASSGFNLGVFSCWMGFLSVVMASFMVQGASNGVVMVAFFAIALSGVVAGIWGLVRAHGKKAAVISAFGLLISIFPAFVGLLVMLQYLAFLRGYASGQ